MHISPYSTSTMPLYASQKDTSKCIYFRFSLPFAIPIIRTDPTDSLFFFTKRKQKHAVNDSLSHSIFFLSIFYHFFCFCHCNRILNTESSFYFGKIFSSKRVSSFHCRVDPSSILFLLFFSCCQRSKVFIIAKSNAKDLSLVIER